MITSRSLHKFLALGLGTALGLAGGLLLWRGARGAAPMMADRDPFAQPPSTFRQRVPLIEAELSESLALPAWAGVYRHGGGFQRATLYAAPKAGFVFVASGCLGVNGSDFGAIETEGVSVRLLSEAGEQAESDALAYLQMELIAVRWGEGEFLIAPAQMIAFVNDARAGLGANARYGSFWQKAGQADVLATMWPAGFLPGHR